MSTVTDVSSWSFGFRRLGSGWVSAGLDRRDLSQPPCRRWNMQAKSPVRVAQGRALQEWRNANLSAGNIRSQALAALEVANTAPAEQRREWAQSRGQTTARRWSSANDWQAMQAIAREAGRDSDLANWVRA